MATLSTRAGEQAYIRVTLGDRRAKITLGWIGKENRDRAGRKITLKQAQQTKDRIELLESTYRTGSTIDPDTQDWLARMNDEGLYGRLVELGMVPKRKSEKSPSLLELVESFKAIKMKTVSAGSYRKIGFALNPLVENLKGSTKVSELTIKNATEWDAWLAGQGHSEAHRRTLARYAKQLFEFAIDCQYIKTNPFRKLKSSALAGDRTRYVTPEETKLLLDACEDEGMRVFIALARYAGLRTPSETHAIEWSNVDWETNSLTVPCKKTRRFKGSTRVVPIVPELREILKSAWTPEAGGKIVTLSTNNLPRKFKRIIMKEFGKVWPKLFQTLRQSCETQFVSMGHQAHAVAQWLGHSEQVSKDHYLMVTGDTFQRATQLRSTQSGSNHIGNHSGQIRGTQEQSKGVVDAHPENEKSLGNQGLLEKSKWPETESNRRHEDFQSSVNHSKHQGKHRETEQVGFPGNRIGNQISTDEFLAVARSLCETATPNQLSEALEALHALLKSKPVKTSALS